MAVALPAQLTIDDARGALDALDAAALAQGAGPLVLDASALARFDTSAVAVLLEMSRRAQARRQTLQISGAPAALGQLVRLYGVDGLLPL